MANFGIGNFFWILTDSAPNWRRILTAGNTLKTMAFSAQNYVQAAKFCSNSARDK